MHPQTKSLRKILIFIKFWYSWHTMKWNQSKDVVVFCWKQRQWILWQLQYHNIKPNMNTVVEKCILDPSIEISFLSGSYTGHLHFPENPHLRQKKFDWFKLHNRNSIGLYIKQKSLGFIFWKQETHVKHPAEMFKSLSSYFLPERRICHSVLTLVLMWP